MPLSMRRQTTKLKADQTRREDLQTRRLKAAELIRDHHTVANVATDTLMSKRTVYRIKKAIQEGQHGALNRLFTPTEHYPGRKPVLSRVEEQMIVDKAIFASERGFTMGEQEMRAMMAQVSNDSREPYVNILPTTYALRSFRARNRELTMRKTENIVTKRIAAQDPEHIQTLIDVIDKMRPEMPELFTKPLNIWNLDETAINASYERRYRGFNAANRRNGGLRMKMKDSGKHLTSIIISCAAGHIAPMFLIAQGKNPVKQWKNPTPPHVTSKLPNDYKWLGEETWFPKGTKLKCSARGSITKELLTEVIFHFNTFARQFVAQDEKILLYVDGHSSKKGVEWLDGASKYNIEVIQLPADTSHILQPCDDRINKVFNENIRNALDVFLYHGAYLNANIAVKMKLAAAAFRTLNAGLAVKSFLNCGLFPLDYEKIRSFGKSPQPDPEPSNSVRLPKNGSARVADHEIATQVRRVARDVTNSTNLLRQIESILQQNPSTNCVIWRPEPVITPTKGKAGTNPGGAPALWLTEGIVPSGSSRVCQGNEESAAAVNSTNEKGNQGQQARNDSLSVSKSLLGIDFDDVPIARWRLLGKRPRTAPHGSIERNEAASALISIHHYR